MVSIGIDIGSVCAKAAAFDGKLMGRLLMPTGWNPRETGTELYKRLINQLETFSNIWK